MLRKALIGSGFLLLPALAAATEMSVAEVALRVVPAAYAAEGVVQAVRQSQIAAQVPGRVVQVAVKAGDSVATGQLLLTIDDRELSQSVAAQQAQVVAAQAQLTHAEASLARTRELVAQKFMSPAALDQADAQARSARAQLDALKAGAGAAAVSKAHTRLVAPYAGVVAEVRVEQGDMASPGTPLMVLFAPGDLRVVAQVPQGRVTAARSLGRAQFEASPGKWQAAGSVKFLPVADAASQMVEVRLQRIPQAGLAPGQSVRVLLATGEARRLVVPNGAVLRRGELSAVYALGPDGRFLQRLVRLGEQFGEAGVEVLAGVKAGEKVALDPVRAGARK